MAGDVGWLNTEIEDKIMKAIILNAVLLVLLAGMMGTPAFAQGGMGHEMEQSKGGDHGDRLEKHVSFLEDRLDLTEDQAKQVEEILRDRKAEAATFKKSQREATHSAIEGVLNDEQKGTFAEMREEMGKDMHKGDMHKGDMHKSKMGGHGDNASGNGMNREAFIEELGLTDEQREQFDALRTSHKAAMKTWKEENPDASAEDSQAFRDETHKSGRDAMEGFLTSEQLAKVDEHHENMGSKGSMGKGHAKGHGAGRMMEQLDLSDDQKSQLKTLKNEQCVSMRDGLKSILTAEQFEELQELREGGKHEEGRGGNSMGDCWK